MASIENMSTSSLYKEYNAIDILKVVLSIFVMIIHSGIDKTVISPVLRTAVPLFFIISSYFFFSKNKKMQSGKYTVLHQLLKRNLFLYLFWAVIQLPLVAFIRGYYQHGILCGVCYLLRDVFIGSGFTGAWYIVALVVGIAIVFWLSQKISLIWLVFLSFPLYVISCLNTNYYNLFDANSIVLLIGNGYRELTGLHFYTSFPIAIFWVAIGKVIAENRFTIKTKVLMFMGVVLVALLALERLFVVRYDLGITDDCYFTLILLCPVIFLLVSRSKFTFITRFRVREFSVLLYVTHGCCGRIVGYILKMIPIPMIGLGFVKMLITLLIAMAITLLFTYLKEKTNNRVFKYIC